MPRITRKLQKIFALNATNNGVFGSAQAGTKVLSTDLATLQGLSAWLNGWNDATISSQRLPTLEEMQALHYITTSQLAYLFQEGIPEWEVGTTYYINSIVKKPSTYELYGSIGNANIGNALPAAVTDANWQYLGNLGSPGINQLTGDVTAGPGSGSQAATIVANAISNAKAAQMAANTIKGNSTASTANQSDIAMAASTILARLASGNIVAASVAQILTLLGIVFTTSADQSITYGTANAVAHSLGARPFGVILEMVCQTGEGNFIAGDIITIGPGQNTQAGAGGDTGIGIYTDATNVTYRFSGDGFRYQNKTAGSVPVSLTAANWKVRVKAFLL